MDEIALKDQAGRAALDFFARMSVPDMPDTMMEMLQAVFEAGWVTGRQAGGDEAIAVIRNTITELLRP